MIQIDRRIFTHFDFHIILLIIPIVAISHFLMIEENVLLAKKQLIYIAIGGGVFIFFFIMPIRKVDWLIPAFFIISVILLISVEFFGVAKLGAQRWLEIPFTNFTIQPSEIIKPAFILMLAYLVKYNPPPKDGYGWVDFAKLSIFIMIPFILILKEPDLGTALVLLLIGYGSLFIVGVNKKIWILVITIVTLASPILFASLEDYQKKRIRDFVSHPSYQVKQAQIAIGSAGIHGKDKEDATQTHLRFLPIATSDFIFPYYVERFGFIGALVLITLFGALIIHLLLLANQLKKDYFTIVISSSLAIMFFIYMSVNILMTIGLAPVVGLPLPLFSYGGSSFIVFMAIFGILENLLAFRYDVLYTRLKY